MASLITLIVLCSVAAFGVACVSGEPDQVGTTTMTSVTPTPTTDREPAIASNVDLTNKSNRQRRSEVPWAEPDKESIKAWRSLVRASAIKDLERTEIAPN